MADDRDLEARVTALESRFDDVAADAAAARHLAAARDRDLSEFATKIDANRQAINALGLQLGGRLTGVENRLTSVEKRLDGHDARFDAVDARFDAVDARFDTLEQKVDHGFAEMRGRLDATAAGQQTIVDLLTGLIERPND